MADKQIEQALLLMKDARGLLEQGIAAVERNNRYNNETITSNDYFPNGDPDYIARLLEPFHRVRVTQTSEQGRDVVGYAAIYAAWIILGMPQSTLWAAVAHLFPHLLPSSGETKGGDSSINSRPHHQVA